MSKQSVNFVILGCSKNTVDSEKIIYQLRQSGFDIYIDADEYTDIVIINTCGFINAAKEESVNTILNFIEAKKAGKVQKVIVMGCLSKRYAEQLKHELPEVDHYFGVYDSKELLKAIQSSDDQTRNKRSLTTPSHYAYLKIADGCNRKCSFCAIPLIKGKYSSYPIEEVIEEAEYLASLGVKELILIAQDTTYYGVDIYKKQMLAELLRKLSGIPNIEWIRINYTFPAHFPLDVIEVMKSEEKVCNYLDIPLQHISTHMLDVMKRGHDKSSTIDFINYLRKQVPDISLRTTFLVGHPGETERDFNELADFIKDVRFDKVGVFAYSHEENTHSYNLYEDEISEKIKQQRVKTLYDIQHKISEEKGANVIGNTLKTIIDRKEGEYFIGRSQYDSPEIDQEIVIPCNESITIGGFYPVTITSYADNDYFGEVEN